jgi:hypothetical protein
MQGEAERELRCRPPVIRAQYFGSTTTAPGEDVFSDLPRRYFPMIVAYSFAARGRRSRHDDLGWPFPRGDDTAQGATASAGCRPADLARPALFTGDERGRPLGGLPRARLAQSLKPLARPKRFELPTPRFVVWCSIQLSYGRAGHLWPEIACRVKRIAASNGFCAAGQEQIAGLQGGPADWRYESRPLLAIADGAR